MPSGRRSARIRSLLPSASSNQVSAGAVLISVACCFIGFTAPFLQFLFGFNIISSVMAMWWMPVFPFRNASFPLILSRTMHFGRPFLKQGVHGSCPYSVHIVSVNGDCFKPKALNVFQCLNYRYLPYSHPAAGGSSQQTLWGYQAHAVLRT